MIDPSSGKIDELPGTTSVTNLGFARDGQFLVITGFDDPPPRRIAAIHAI